MEQIINRSHTERNTYHVISKLSHELRTPLAIVYSNLQLLDNYNNEIDEELQQEAFNLSFLAINNIIRLLDNISIFNKSNNDSLSLHNESVMLPELIENATGELNSLKEYKNRIIVNSELTQKAVLIDEFLVEHILSNVLINALKFSDNDTSVVLSVWQQDKNIFFSIADKGIGIKEDELESICDSFFRGSNSEMTKGSGLGLNIAKRCVDLHGGSISISSVLNQGTTVKIRIPYE